MAAKSKLTDKQKNFCKFVAEQYTYADAYRKAYNAGNRSDGSVRDAAHKLMKKPEIKQKVEELKAKQPEKQYKKKTDLTDKQEKFCQHVAEGDTYADAYRKAYSAGRMGVNTIYVNSSVMMNDNKIVSRIEELRQQNLKRHQVTVDELLNNLAAWLRFDPLELIDQESEAVKSLKDMTEETRKSISEIHVQELFASIDGEKTKIGEVKKVKFYDKTKVADMFMKKFGQYVPDKSETSSNLEAIKEILQGIKK